MNAKLEVYTIFEPAEGTYDLQLDELPRKGDLIEVKPGFQVKVFNVTWKLSTDKSDSGIRTHYPFIEAEG